MYAIRSYYGYDIKFEDRKRVWLVYNIKFRSLVHDDKINFNRISKR